MSSELWMIATEKGREDWEDENEMSFDDLPEDEQLRLDGRFYEDYMSGLCDRSEYLEDR